MTDNINEKQVKEQVDNLVSERQNNLEDQSKGMDIVQRAEIAAKILKAENDRKEQLLNLEKEMQARQMLGGRADAGHHIPERTKEEIADEEAKAILKLFR